jgi:hypothetical protein
MLFALAICLVTSNATTPDTVVVCPAEFRGALEPWLAHRARQGHSLGLVSNQLDQHEIRHAIRQAAIGGRLKSVVLVGDAEPGTAFDGKVRARCVPVHWAQAKVNVFWGSEPHIATDNWYADLNDDAVPDVAIGRLTADSPDELSEIVGKILSYEQSSDFGQWRRQLNIVAGVGEFGFLADTALEAAARFFLTYSVPPAYQVSVTYGNWRSPYCPDPRQFHFASLQRLNEGCQFWIYIGHGYHTCVDRIRMPDGEYHILANWDIDKLECQQGLPIAVFLACYAGAFDARQDCLAEHMLRTPGAPVAVIAGSRVTMPYAMAVMSRELMKQCFHGRCQTLGEAVLRAKQSMVRPPSAGELGRATLDAIATFISPKGAEPTAERQEHLLLFNLIGDPLLRLSYPDKVSVEISRPTETSKRLDVRGTTPLDGEATVELVLRRDRFNFDPPLRVEYPRRSSDLAEFQEVYSRANARELSSVKSTVEGGTFQARLPVPEGVHGPCHVRVFVKGLKGFAMGSADIDFPANERNPEKRHFQVEPPTPLSNGASETTGG